MHDGETQADTAGSPSVRRRAFLATLQRTLTTSVYLTLGGTMDVQPHYR